MKKYTTLLFDADETLLDFQKDETAAIMGILDYCSVEKSEKNIATYKKVNKSLWKSIEKGEIDKETLKKIRFSLFFKEIGYTSNEDPFKTNERYLSYLASGGSLLSGARELLDELHDEGYDMYIVTNGIEKTQKQRLTKAGIIDYFNGIFVSEAIGYQKPRKEYFSYVLSHINERDISKVLLIGDSLTSDILGAVNAGIPCAWLRHDSAASPGTLTPDYIIDSITQVKSLL